MFWLTVCCLKLQAVKLRGVVSQVTWDCAWLRVYVWKLLSGSFDVCVLSSSSGLLGERSMSSSWLAWLAVSRHHARLCIAHLIHSTVLGFQLPSIALTHVKAIAKDLDVLWNKTRTKTPQRPCALTIQTVSLLVLCGLSDLLVGSHTKMFTSFHV